MPWCMWRYMSLVTVLRSGMPFPWKCNQADSGFKGNAPKCYRKIDRRNRWSLELIQVQLCNRQFKFYWKNLGIICCFFHWILVAALHFKSNERSVICFNRFIPVRFVRFGPNSKQVSSRPTDSLCRTELIAFDFKHSLIARDSRRKSAQQKI